MSFKIETYLRNEEGINKLIVYSDEQYLFNSIVIIFFFIGFFDFDAAAAAAATFVKKFPAA